MTFLVKLWDIFWWKKFSIVLLFSCDSCFGHECSANFRSLFAHFWWFFVKIAQYHKIFAETCDFFHFEYISGANVWPGGGGATFNFQPILADFSEYTLSVASYHVAEAINGYFENWNLMFIHKPIDIPNLVKELKAKVGFLWGGGGAKSSLPAQPELRISPRKIGLMETRLWRMFKSFKWRLERINISQPAGIVK